MHGLVHARAYYIVRPPTRHEIKQVIMGNYCLCHRLLSEDCPGLANSRHNSHPSEPIDILAITNLEQSKVAITGLKKLGGFNDKYGQHWLVEQHGRKIGLPIILSEDTNTVRYSAVLISVDCLDRIETNHVSEIQTQARNMNIDETRKLGLGLCRDPEAFVAWCDKVGNHWLDTPLYGAVSKFRDVKNGKIVVFETLHTYNNDKPWCIQVTIEDHSPL